ncbi:MULTISPECIES: histidine phosphatase family protein [unclassified Pseudofrankia]|uniref:histidine phosphatase family protein n=1 Tax=unclassified Pseudofrankia TaxID=2994372 RepID=UPI0008DAC0EE|nr:MULTISPECIES: histidine phosphatase family protein [unclassified Pseudofrankia]MDT3439600.1 histidine phosphatase family protein [Pseudofrankia sp. BMG5.37]OHV67041.1 phosphoglycerate mutase [Pseudofrankia sp. BMG5.36]
MSVIYLVRHGQASFGTADYDVLSELGYRQAALVGAELRARGVRAGLATTGTLRRQRETAAAALAAIAEGPAVGAAEGGGVLADGAAGAVALAAAGTDSAAGASLAAGTDVAVAGWSGDVETDSRWNEYDQDWIINRHADVGSAPAGEGQLPPSRGMSSRSFQGLLDVALSEWIASTNAGPGSYVAFSDGVGDALDGLVRRLGSGGTAVVFSSGGPIAAVCARLLDLRVDGIISLNRVMINGSITKIVSGRSGTSLISFNEHSHIDAAGREFLSYR